MAFKCNSNLSRALSVADYILEDNGHSVKEAAKEFRVCETTILRDLNFLGEMSQCNYIQNYDEIRKKYIAVRKKLAELARKNNANNIQKFNLSKPRKINN